MGNIDEGAEVLMGHTVQQVNYYNTPCTASRPHLTIVTNIFFDQGGHPSKRRVGPARCTFQIKW